MGIKPKDVYEYRDRDMHLIIERNETLTKGCPPLSLMRIDDHQRRRSRSR